MDPTKCLAKILEELSQGSAEERGVFPEDKLRALAHWIDHGGAPPDVDEAVGRYCASLAEELDDIPKSHRKER